MTPHYHVSGLYQQREPELYRRNIYTWEQHDLPHALAQVTHLIKIGHRNVMIEKCEVEHVLPVAGR